MDAQEVRFWGKVAIGPGAKCWLWKGMVFQRTGYGGAVFDGRLQGAHRVAYQIECGPIPGGMFVLHNCDTKLCVNPAHLRLGTALDNARDAVERGLYATGDRHPSSRLPDWGRHPRINREGYIRGERQHSAKLTADDVRAIRATAEPSRSIASRYGVTHGAILAIRAGRTWRHVV